MRRGSVPYWGLVGDMGETLEFHGMGVGSSPTQGTLPGPRGQGFPLLSIHCASPEEE